MKSSPSRPDMLDPELVQSTKQIAEALTRRSAQYALIGGMAVGVRSRPRSTKDADFIVQVSAFQLPALLEELKDLGFEIDVIPTIRKWTQERFIAFYRGRVRIDWMQPILPIYTNVMKSAETKQWQDTPINVATSEGLILTKLISFRSQDQADIETLVRANPNLDRGWIWNEWITSAPDEPVRTTWLEDAFRRLLPAS